MSALATAIVLYAGDPRAAVAAVARSTGRVEWELEPAQIADGAVAPRAELTGSPAPASCAAPTTSAAVHAAVSRAEARVVAAEWGPAAAELDGGIVAIGCLTDPVEASIAARLFLLDGAVYAMSGDPSRAQRSFRQAITFQSGLPWDAVLPVDARVPFDAIAAEVRPSVHIALGTGVADPSSVFIDGRPAGAVSGGFDVVAGPHVLQVIAPTIATLAVDVAPGAALTLTVPAALDADAVTRAGDPAVRAAITAVIVRSYPDRQVYVWTGESVLDATHDWALIPAGRAPAHLGAELITGGALVSGLGLVATGYGFATYLSKIQPPPGETAGGQTRRFIDGSRAGGVAQIGVAMVVEGLVAVGVGVPLALHEGRARVRVGISPAGATITVGGAP